MSDDLADVITEAVGEAINTAVQQHERGFVTKWVALVESVDPEGVRGLWTMTSDDLMAWDTVGMLQHALHLQTARTLTRGEGDA